MAELELGTFIIAGLWVTAGDFEYMLGSWMMHLTAEMVTLLLS